MAICGTFVLGEARTTCVRARAGQFDRPITGLFCGRQCSAACPLGADTIYRPTRPTSPVGIGSFAHIGHTSASSFERVTPQRSALGFGALSSPTDRGPGLAGVG